jgi:hypothetical protein
MGNKEKKTLSKLEYDEKPHCCARLWKWLLEVLDEFGILIFFLFNLVLCCVFCYTVTLEYQNSTIYTIQGILLGLTLMFAFGLAVPFHTGPHRLCLLHIYTKLLAFFVLVQVWSQPAWW